MCDVSVNVAVPIKYYDSTFSQVTGPVADLIVHAGRKEIFFGKLGARLRFDPTLVHNMNEVAQLYYLFIK